MNNQSGNVLFLILISVALFAALSYVVTNSTRGGGGSSAKERAQLYAGEILSYTTTIKTAVNRIMLSGCRSDQLDFHTAAYTRNDGVTANNTPNANAPSDGSCAVFEPTGGNVTPYIVSTDGLDLNNPGIGNPSDYRAGTPAFRVINIAGVGTSVPATPALDSNDLVMLVNHLNRDTCMAINDLLKIDNPNNDAPAQVHVGSGGQYTNGSFAGTMVDTTFSGRAFFCLKTPGDNYQFNAVVLER